MTEPDWKRAFVEQQMEFARQLGCNSHPNDISAAICELQRRAAVGDRKRARRQATLRAAMVSALEAEGVTKIQIRRLARDLDALAASLVSPHV